MMDKVANELTFEIVQKINNKAVTIANGIDLLKVAMETIETKQVSGQQKSAAVKEAVFNVGHDLVLLKFVSQEVADNIKLFVESDILSSMIDLVVAGTKGNLDINTAYSSRKNPLQTSSTANKAMAILGQYGKFH